MDTLLYSSSSPHLIIPHFLEECTHLPHHHHQCLHQSHLIVFLIFLHLLYTYTNAPFLQLHFVVFLRLHYSDFHRFVVNIRTGIQLKSCQGRRCRRSYGHVDCHVTEWNRKKAGRCILRFWRHSENGERRVE